MEPSRVRLDVPLLIYIVLICCLEGILAQSTKSGSLSASSFSFSEKGGKNGVISSSKFRTNIESVKASLHQQKEVVSSGSISSSGKTNEITQQQHPIISNLHEFSSSVQEEKQGKKEEQQQQLVVDQVVEDKQDGEYRFYGAVDGVPGVDFPGYTSIPVTHFTCANLPYDPGMYADEETGCQVYHLCYTGRRESFLCGVGTLFNQENLNCDFWYKVECSKSSQFYSRNAEFGKSLPEPSSVKLDTAVASIKGFSSSSLKQTVNSQQFSAVKGNSQVLVNSKNTLDQTHGTSKVSPHRQAFAQRLTQTQTRTLTPVQVNNIRKSYMQLEQSLDSQIVKAESKGRQVGATLTVVQMFSDDEAGIINQAGKSSSSLNTSFKLASSEKNAPKSSDKKIDNDEWRPYFKSKSRSNIIANTPPLHPSSSTSLEPKSLTPPNEKPNFRLTSSSIPTPSNEQTILTTTSSPLKFTFSTTKNSSSMNTVAAATAPDESTTSTTPTSSSSSNSPTTTEEESSSPSFDSDMPTTQPEVSTTRQP